MPKETVNPGALINRLELFTTTFPALVCAFNPEDIKWKPDKESWSVLEIVCHMTDEEQEDFSLRVFSTLCNPDATWPPIDPQGWVESRNYASQDLDTQLDRWTQLRTDNINQLRSLTNPNWSNTMQHPHFGPMSAIGLLAAWSAHDALHLRQLARRLHQLAFRDANSDPTTRYAGDW